MLQYNLITGMFRQFGKILRLRLHKFNADLYTLDKFC